MADSARVIAEALRSALPDLPQKKMHKLLYYAQAWHLTLIGEPLFPEAIEAWDMGPVVANVWREEKYGTPDPAGEPLTSDELATVDYIVDRYGHHTGGELETMTHEEQPWKIAQADNSSKTIEAASLIKYFEQDDQYVEHRAEAARLQRAGAHSLNSINISDQLDDAIRRTLAGDRNRPKRTA